jgi:hypothetical protein
MAKSSAARSAKVQIVRMPSPPAPIMLAAPKRRRRATTTIVKAKKTSHRRHGVGASSPLTAKHMFGIGVGGLALGYIEKHWGANLPTMPVIGRKGTIAVGAYFLAKHGGMGAGIARDVAIAAAALAGYDLGNKGSISGDLDGDVDGEVAPQIGRSRVRGVSAQI